MSEIGLERAVLNLFFGDETHPGWGEYVAFNLREALRGAQDTGDWYQSVMTVLDRLVDAPPAS